jgi:hypothetical protein
MEKLTVKFPDGTDVEFEIDPKRAKELYLAGAIVRVRPGYYEAREYRAEDPLCRLVIALLDLQGDYL